MMVTIEKMREVADAMSALAIERVPNLSGSDCVMIAAYLLASTIVDAARPGHERQVWDHAKGMIEAALAAAAEVALAEAGNVATPH